MSSWRGNDLDPNFSDEMDSQGGLEEEEVCFIDIKQEVCDDSEEEEDKIKMEDDLQSAPSPEAYTPHSSPEPRKPAVDRDRSRSPIVKVEPASDTQPSSSGIVIRTFDKKELPLADEDHSDDDDAELYWAPDAHASYESMNKSDDMNVEDRNEGEKNARTAVMQEQTQCVSQTDRRGRARRGGHESGSRHQLGDQQPRLAGVHPLKEIWITDDDIPSKLKELARDVVRKREARAQELRDKAIRIKREREFEGQESESESEDEFQNATDGRGNPLLEGKGLLFEWSPMETFQPEEEVFTPERTGSVECHLTPYDAFRSFWDDSLMEHIVNKTNWYASQITTSAFQKDWYPTNAHEVMCLFAFWMMLGIVRMPTIRSCFSVNPLLKTDIFSRIFTQKRYNTLLRAFHFMDADLATVAANPTNSDTAASCDRLYSLRPIINRLNTNFQANYIPSKDIFIDENITLWKERLNTRQYLQPKDAKLGIKTFELCDSATGYLWSFIVCSGKNCSLDLQPDSQVNSTAIVKKLVNPLLNKGYRLFMDSFFNSPRLARFLKRNGTDCVGTLPPRHQDVPALINLAPLKQGQLVARHSGDVCVLSWQDKRRITMISTCHGTAAVLVRVPKSGNHSLEFMPQVVLDYENSIGGVDLTDQLLEPYLIERREKKRGVHWHVKLFKQLLNASILNARILMESSVHRIQENLNFRLSLVDTILANHFSYCPKNCRESSTAINRFPLPVRMVPHIHWPVLLDQSIGYASRNRKTRVRCTVCLREGRKTTKTTYKCEGCNVPLCVEYCFKKYHTSSEPS